MFRFSLYYLARAALSLCVIVAFVAALRLALAKRYRGTHRHSGDVADALRWSVIFCAVCLLLYVAFPFVMRLFGAHVAWWNPLSWSLYFW